MQTVTGHQRCYGRAAGEPSAPGNFYILQDNISPQGLRMKPSSQGPCRGFAGQKNAPSQTPPQHRWSEQTSGCQECWILFSSSSTQVDMCGERPGSRVARNVARFSRRSAMRNLSSMKHLPSKSTEKDGCCQQQGWLQRSMEHTASSHWSAR